MQLKRGSILSISQAGNELENPSSGTRSGDFSLDLAASVLGRNELEIRLDNSFWAQFPSLYCLLSDWVINFRLLSQSRDSHFLGQGIWLGNGAQVSRRKFSFLRNTELAYWENSPGFGRRNYIDPSQIEELQAQKQVERGASLLVDQDQ